MGAAQAEAVWLPDLEAGRPADDAATLQAQQEHVDDDLHLQEEQHQQRRQQQAAGIRSLPPQLRPRRHPWQHHDPDQPSGTQLDAAPSSNLILMFDLNGTLTSLTSNAARL